MAKRVLISGASGLVGRALTAALRARGTEVSRLVRRAPNVPDEIAWDPRQGILDAAQLAGFDGVVHLAGENVASGRWTVPRRNEIFSSRVESTRLLVERLTSRSEPPPVFVCASAIGFYGDRGDEILDEQSGLSGEGFLTATCAAWERQLAPLHARGARVVAVRTGIVLAREGGALPKMLAPFRLGLGGRLGSGRQWWSWIALEDLVEIYARALVDAELRGPINATAPHPVTNLEFTRALARALHRPALCPVPAFVLRLVLGRGMANELLLSSTRVLPRKLEHVGFTFRHPELAGALEAVLGRRARSAKRA